ncbi:MAG: MBL fold metallo-hydrolase [Methanohalobium sp.]|uniref:MBL fold metallo-hydrolase n=1 Tax=Methanohalobium sp. TaxID=2837493 RepID=UPI003979A5DD
MDISERLIDLGIFAFRQKNARGTFKPHLSIGFRSNEGRLHTFSIDTTRIPEKYTQPDAYLITHAHGDHHGKSAMLSNRSFCSDKTALALETRYGKQFRGISVEVGDTAYIGDVPVKTYPTEHTVGSTAFYWENDVGTRILVTGDVKDPTHLPECDVLITEANYGDPADLKCHFDDDLEGFKNTFENCDCIAFGAYAFGKAQRTVELLRNIGYNGAIEMEKKTLNLTRLLLDNPGELSDIGGYKDGCVCVVPPHNLGDLPEYISKYTVTGRMNKSQEYPSIQISDHLDAFGLVSMVKTINPEFTIVYHPKGNRPLKFADYLNSMGFESISIDDINNVLSNEFI